MRKLMAASVAICGFGFGGLHAAAATPHSITGMYTVHFPKSGQQKNVYPCPAGTFCALGDLNGSAAVYDVFDSNFQPLPNSNCLSFDQELDVQLLGTASTLVLVGSGTLCFPGSSGNVPQNPNNQDYGHPSHWAASLSVDGAASTGAFSGSHGSVTEDQTVAGGVGVARFSGTVTEP